MVEFRPFEKEIDTLTKKDFKSAKSEIMQMCRWSHQTFSQKMKGQRSLRRMSQKKINEPETVNLVLTKYGITTWSNNLKNV